MVAKYAQTTVGERVDTNIEGVSKEAAIMMQLNALPESEGVLFLRNFRCYSDAQLWLYLLEYCPNLGLEPMRLTYKAMRYVECLFLVSW